MWYISVHIVNDVILFDIFRTLLTKQYSVNDSYDDVEDDLDILWPVKMVTFQLDIDGHVFKTDSIIEERIDQTISKFIYGCNIGFSAIENPLFISMDQVPWLIKLQQRDNP